MLKRMELAFYLIVDTLQSSPAREMILALIWGWWTSVFLLMMCFFQSREAAALVTIWLIPLVMVSAFMYDEELDKLCGIGV